MSNFSYLSPFPIGVPILDLTDDSRTIDDLNLSAARKYVEWWKSFYGETGQGKWYSEWDDNYIGSMWPIAMTLEDAMHYYWKSSGFKWYGANITFKTKNYSISEFEAPLILRYLNFKHKYTCPPSGYDSKNFGDEFYAALINVEDDCFFAQSLFHAKGSWNYESCFFESSVENLVFSHIGFSASLGELNGTFFGGDDTFESLRQNYPSIIKINNDYYPAINLNIQFGPYYRIFTGGIFSVLRKGRETIECFSNDPTNNNFDPFLFEAALYDTANGPYSVNLTGFPSGNTYEIPIYNIVQCFGDDNGSCPNPNFAVACGVTASNAELFPFEIISP